MSRVVLLLLSLPALVVGCAAGPANRPKVDESAMREAMEGANRREERQASSGSFAHFLRAKVAEDAGDHRGALDELRLALATDEGNPFLTTELVKQYARLSELDKAEHELKVLLERHPNYAPAQLLMGKILFEAHKASPAIIHLRRAIQLNPTDADAYLVLAQLQLDLEAPDEAVRTIEAYAAASPGETVGYKRLGLALADRADAERAEKLLSRAAAIDPGDAETWLALAQIFESAGRSPKAEQAYDRALEADPDNREALLAAAKLAVHRGLVARARAYFDRLMVVSEDPEFAVKVAFSYLATGQVPAAAEVLDSARAAGLREPRLSFYAGLVHQKLLRFAKAAAAYGEIPADSELFQEARVHRASCLSLAGQHTRALELFKKALESKPDYVLIYPAYARALERSGARREAHALLSKAIRDRPSPELFEALAETYQREGRLAEGISLLSEALAKSPKDETLLYTLGALYERKGDLDKSIAQMRQLLEINPDHAAALNFIGYSLADRGRDLEEAEKFLVRALELKPDSAAFLDSLGWLYFRKGDYQRALDTLERANALEPNEPVIAEHLGDVYRRMAKQAKAAEAYRRALNALVATPELEEVKGQKRGLQRKLKRLSRDSAGQ
jgi:tetratricopeptide (TPR) repeat protein